MAAASASPVLALAAMMPARLVYVTMRGEWMDWQSGMPWKGGRRKKKHTS